MAAQLLLLNEVIPASALGLGSLVESLKYPAIDAYTFAGELPTDEVISTQAQSFGALFSEAKSPSFRLHLSRAIGLTHIKTDEEDFDLKSVAIKHRQLRRPREVFKRLCQDDAAREWLNAGIQGGRKSFMVVDLQTAQSPSLTQRQSHMKDKSIDLTVPISAAISGGADVLGLGEVLDSGAGAGISASATAQKSFTVEGEAIFAIGFKRVVWKSWSLKRKDVEQASLDADVTWTILGARRSRSDESDDERVSLGLSDDLQTIDGVGASEAESTDEDEGLDPDDDDDDLKKLLKHQMAVGDHTYMMFDN